MLSEQTAKSFATEWVNSWNSHDIDAIMHHYADEIKFYSPMIASLKFNEDGCITNKDDLKKYFLVGLNAYPDLQFKLHHVFTGVNSLVIYYTSVNEKLSAEVFELNEEGKAVRVLCNYTK